MPDDDRTEEWEELGKDFIERKNGVVGWNARSYVKDEGVTSRKSKNSGKSLSSLSKP